MYSAKLVIRTALLSWVSLFLVHAIGMAEEPPRERTFDGKLYQLTFHDEFDGRSLDDAKWRFRILGICKSLGWMNLTDDAAWLDGRGASGDADLHQGEIRAATAGRRGRQLFRPMGPPRIDASHQAGVQVWIPRGAAQDAQSCRAVGMAVWMQSRGQTRRNPSADPKAGSEIDIIEQTFFSKTGKPTDYKHATIHWGGYADTHQWVSIVAAPSDGKPADASHDAELGLKEKERSGALIREYLTQPQRPFELP